jgi:hypothetical protein
MAPAWTTARRSARGISIFAAANASSSAASNPVSPEIAARSGRMIGNGRKFRSSRLSRGNRPARRNDDLREIGPGRSAGQRGRISTRQRSVSSDAGHFATRRVDHHRSLPSTKINTVSTAAMHTPLLRWVKTGKARTQHAHASHPLDLLRARRKRPRCRPRAR